MCCYSHENIQGDNCCACNISVILQSTGIPDADVICAYFTNRVNFIFLSVYNACVRHIVTHISVSVD